MIGIFLTATNMYYPLGLRFANKFYKHYQGDIPYKFFFFTEEDPVHYLPHMKDLISFHKTYHFDWLGAVNNRFSLVLNTNIDTEYIYHFDADTNININFTMDNMLGNIVGGEHFGNKTWMKDKKNYDRNPASAAYIPYNTHLPQMYYLGAFWGGKTTRVKQMCETLVSWQTQDKLINYEPAVNDESYLNKYFHYNDHKTILLHDFPFQISCKGGIPDTRNYRPEVRQSLLSQIKQVNTIDWDIYNGNISHGR